MRTEAAWNILLPIGIALCVVLSICVGALCIRGHIKQDDTNCNPGPPRRLSNHSCVRRSKLPLSYPCLIWNMTRQMPQLPSICWETTILIYVIFVVLQLALYIAWQVTLSSVSICLEARVVSRQSWVQAVHRAVMNPHWGSVPIPSR